MKRVRACSLVGAMLLLCGCATTKPPSSGPEILSNTTSGGRGSPWGRSDSLANFTRITAITSDPSYGLTAQNPIRVGGLAERNEAEYLNGLRGPAGEPIEYERLGSCCPFKTPNAIIEGTGLLDAFRVTHAGQATPSILYIDFYDEAPLYVPVGFTPRSD